MVDKDAVMKVLDGIDDPELKKPLTELGMVKSVKIDNENVNVSILLTIAGCPLKHKITKDIQDGVGALEGVSNVTVDFGVMNDQQRDQLKHKLGHLKTLSDNKPAPLTYAKRFIAVASGKGGVGKSTMTTNLASAMARLGKKVGVLDADVYGFSIPRMMGLKDRPTIIDDKIVPLRIGDNMQVVSMGLFIDEDEPVVWRGPLVHKAINQFLSDVMWDELDYLFMDLPPGTGDVTITIAQAVPSAELVVITTPQSTATHVAGRVAKLAEKTNVKVIGVIENMAYYENNGQKDYIFGKDGGKELAKELGVPLLGEVPLMTAIREGADSGAPIASHGDVKQVALFESIAKKLDEIKVG